MQRHQSNPPSASNHAIGVLGRLMRAFPARAVADANDVVDALQQPKSAVARTPISTATGPQGVLARLEAWIWRQQQRDREAYLADATDIADLEARMRVLELRQIRNQRPF